MQRTEMLWSKEEYVEFSHAHLKMKAKVLEVQEEIRSSQANGECTTGEPESIDESGMDIKDLLVNLQQNCERAKQNANAAENNYRRKLDKLNDTVDVF